MTCGILQNKRTRPLFEEINARRLCKECRGERNKFVDFDKKGSLLCYSNLLPGFSSEKVDIPLDVLVVSEAHGGGGEDNFCKQRELDYEVSEMCNYYTMLPDKTFHQQQLRHLLKHLNNIPLLWVFTDLIKCFVWHGSDKKRGLDGSLNKRTAIGHCRSYLEKQIAALQPRIVVGLGGTVSKYFGLKRPSHASVQTISIVGCNFNYIHSMFPAQWTADQWVKNKGWELIIDHIDRMSIQRRFNTTR